MQLYCLQIIFKYTVMQCGNWLGGWAGGVRACVAGARGTKVGAAFHTLCGLRDATSAGRECGKTWQCFGWLHTSLTPHIYTPCY